MSSDPNPLAIDVATFAATDADPDEIAALAALVDDMGALASELPKFPPSAPRPGESTASWAAEVARRRAEHDAIALAEQLRQLVAPAAGRVEPDRVERSWGEIDAPGGPVAARWYRPTEPSDRAADTAIAYFHGGAFWMGGGATGFAINDAPCARLAAATGATIVNVDYRLAPEHRFPAQLDDGAAAVRHLADRFARVGVAGNSSGGFLCTGLAWRSRNGELPPLAMVLLLQPAVNLGPRAPSTDGDDAAAELRRRIVEYYLLDEADWSAPHVTAANDEDLGGLAPTILVTGDQDLLAAPARRYASRLADAGVAVSDLRYTMTHTIATPEVRRRMDTEVLAAIRATLAAE